MKYLAALLILIPSYASSSMCHLDRNANTIPKRILKMMKRKKPKLVKQIILAANESGVDPILYAAILGAESDFIHNSKSKTGDVGIAQINPINLKPHAPPLSEFENLKLGAKLLKYWQNKYGHEGLWWCHYNSGNRLYIKTCKSYNRKVMKYLVEGL